jgi:toxin-antitoxin system PIN domain toxin
LTLADVNVLLHAFRSDSMNHKEARDWLEDTLNGPSAFGISPQVLSGVLRISTHRRIYKNPSDLGQALDFSSALLNHSRAVVVKPGEHHWSIFGNLCEESKAIGNLVPDAWFAALAIEWSCEWITYDRDFARFPGLRWRSPS